MGLEERACLFARCRLRLVPLDLQCDGATLVDCELGIDDATGVASAGNWSCLESSNRSKGSSVGRGAIKFAVQDVIHQLENPPTKQTLHKVLKCHSVQASNCQLADDMH